MSVVLLRFKKNSGKLSELIEKTIDRNGRARLMQALRVVLDQQGKDHQGA